MKKLFLFFALISTSLASQAVERELIGALPSRGKLWLEDGKVRAVNINGQTRWKFSRKQIGLAGQNNEQPDFRRNDFVFSGDKRIFALRAEELIQVHESSTGKLRFQASLWPDSAKYSQRNHGFQFANFQNVMIPGAGAYVTGMGFSPDGKHLAVSGWLNVEKNQPGVEHPDISYFGRVAVFRTTTGALVRQFDISGAHMNSVRWKTNGRLIAKSGDGKTRLYSLLRRR